MILDYKRLRDQWRDLNLRVAKLERQMRETDGMVDALLSDAEYTPHPDLGMNGQHRRKEVVQQLFSKLKFGQVIETGTFLGATTGYFSTQFNVPVYSSELMPRNHHFARRSLRNLSDIHLSLQDSRSFLRELAGRSDLTEKRTFFYLDAHWYEDLPLADEIDLLAPVWDKFVLLIDDFQVPSDSGYEYDDYGPGKALTMEYLDPIVAKHELTVFFPKANSSDETGKRRGYCVVASASLVNEVQACNSLVQH